MSRSRIKCAHCKRRIRDHQPDLVLRDLDNGGRDRYYHTTCGGAAYAAAAQKPALYRLTVRHVEGAMN
jgi:hypothetical protein